MKTKADLLNWIDENQKPFVAMADKIWANPEPAYREFQAAKWQAEYLAAEGFELTWDIGGLNTAFEARWGSGGPKIGFVGEYDALDGLSQKAQPDPEPLVAGAPGHGCGHNLLGTGALAAAVAVSKWLAAENRSGTVSYYGCPAEERLAAKTFMAAAGAFSDLDAAFNFHPGSCNRPGTGSAVGLLDVCYRFHGTTAHAGSAPHKGRSALDAVELMNIGVNYLREHVPEYVRMHYVIKNGGELPNIVPSEAEVWYFLRALQPEELRDVARRVDQIAQGAALMTETSMERIVNGACSNVLNNRYLAQLQYRAMERIGPITYNEAELAFADRVNGHQPAEAVDTFFDRLKMPAELESQTDRLKQSALLGVNLPPLAEGRVMTGSTDVGDVSWNTPLSMLTTTCCTTGAQSHHWSYVATCGMSIGHKGMLHAAKVMALAAVDLFREPEHLKLARAEFEDAVKARPYISPIPADVKPPHFENPCREQA